MLSTLFSISSLLLGILFLLLCHGLQNSLLGLRAQLENFSTELIGFMMSAYFIGFVFGVKFGAKYIPSVGHIRVFAATASIISITSLLHFLFVNEIFWVLLRFIYGICISASYMVIESWLNNLASAKNRGRILSTYMIINFSAIGLSQFLLDMAPIDAFNLFAICSILASISLVPLILSRKAKQPEEKTSQVKFGIKELFKISPLAIIAVISYGIITGAIWGLGAVVLQQHGFSFKEIALFISLLYLGGMIFQWPLGLLSDILNRRVIIVLCALISCIAYLLLYFSMEAFMMSGSDDRSLKYIFLLSLISGGFTYTIYSLSISLANDYVETDKFVKVSAGLLSVLGASSIIGPIIGGFVIRYFGASCFFLLLSCASFALLLFSIIRVLINRKIPISTRENFIPLPSRTGETFYKLDPRYSQTEEGKEGEENKEAKKS